MHENSEADAGNKPRRMDSLIRAIADVESRMLSAGPPVGRRTLLKGGALWAGAAAAGAMLAPKSLRAAGYPVQDDPMKEQGRAIGLDGGYGSRSQFETVARYPFPTPNPFASFSLSPLAESRGIIMPSGLHFERHHAGIPNIDPASHELLIHGMVDRPMKFTVEELKRLPGIARILFIECSGNSFSEWKGPLFKTVQTTHGLTSTSEWAGVPLSTLLGQVGVKPGAKWILAEGRDAAGMTRSIPLWKAWDDIIVAYGQNGEALRPEQGYPLRLVIPGWEGNCQIKWLRRLKIGDAPFMTREETSKYTDLLADGHARQFSFVMEAKSVITFPSGEMELPGRGFYELTGLAWSGKGTVRRVEVSTNGGMTWHLAQLDQPVLPLAHTRFRYPWRWDGSEAILQSRCTDETGYTQPTRQALIAARGAHGRFGSLYHFNGIQSWRVRTDGRVENVAA